MKFDIPTILARTVLCRMPVDAAVRVIIGCCVRTPLLRSNRRRLPPKTTDRGAPRAHVPQYWQLDEVLLQHPQDCILTLFSGRLPN
jgi:hypothetical protein